MGSGCVPQEPALAAGRILAAMESGSLAEVERGLQRAEQLTGVSDSATLAEEQIELLDAVTHQMRHSMRRFERQLTPHIEGVEVFVRLLRHLAQPNPLHAANSVPPPPSLPN